MRALFSNLLTASVSGSIVILAVLVLRLVLRKTPKKFICMLWMVAGLRLLLPVPLQSRFSLQPPTIRLPQSETLQTYLVPLWCIVAVSLLCASLISYAHLRRQVKDARKIRGGWECEGLETAFVLGFLKPKIYIPAGVSDNTRQQILAHERTHLDKGDHWIKLIGFLALVLHWFNPLVWVSYILLCKDIEMACDQRVVQFMDLPERKAYSAALLDCSTHKVHYAACPVAFGEVSVKYRIKSVLSYKKPAFWISLLCWPLPLWPCAWGQTRWKSRKTRRPHWCRAVGKIRKPLPRPLPPPPWKTRTGALRPTYPNAPPPAAH